MIKNLLSVKIQINTAYLEEIISNCKNGLIVSHFNPDGDAVGSIVAFYYYLKGRDIDAKLVLPSGYPDFLSFLDPKEEKIKISFFQKKEVLSLIKSADTIFCLDFNKLSRTEDLEEEIRQNYNNDYMEGKSIHTFHEIMDILEYVPDGYSLEDDEEEEHKKEEDNYDDIEDVQEEEDMEEDETMHWDEDEEEENEEDYGRHEDDTDFDSFDDER